MVPSEAMKKLEMQDTLEWAQGCILLLADGANIQVLSEFSSDPARCWLRPLPAPSTPFAELIHTRSRASGAERAQIGLCSLTCGDILVCRRYSTHHYETGVVHRLDRLGMDGQFLGSIEVFSSLAKEEEARSQLDMSESGSAVLVRLVDERGRVLREQRWDESLQHPSG